MAKRTKNSGNGNAASSTHTAIVDNNILPEVSDRSPEAFGSGISDTKLYFSFVRLLYYIDMFSTLLCII